MDNRLSSHIIDYPIAKILFQDQNLVEYLINAFGNGLSLSQS